MDLSQKEIAILNQADKWSDSDTFSLENNEVSNGNPGNNHGISEHVDVDRQHIFDRRDAQIVDGQKPIGHMSSRFTLSGTDSPERAVGITGELCGLMKEVVAENIHEIAEFLNDPSECYDISGNPQTRSFTIHCDSPIGEGCCIGDRDGAVHPTSTMMVVIAPPQDSNHEYSVRTFYSKSDYNEYIDCVEAISHNLVDIDRKDFGSLTAEEQALKSIDLSVQGAFGLDIADYKVSFAEFLDNANSFDSNMVDVRKYGSGIAVDIKDQDGRVTQTGIFVPDVNGRFTDASRSTTLTYDDNGNCIGKHDTLGKLTDNDGNRIAVKFLESGVIVLDERKDSVVTERGNTFSVDEYRKFEFDGSDKATFTVGKSDHMTSNGVDASILYNSKGEPVKYRETEKWEDKGYIHKEYDYSTDRLVRDVKVEFTGEKTVVEYKSNGVEIEKHYDRQGQFESGVEIRHDSSGKEIERIPVDGSGQNRRDTESGNPGNVDQRSNDTERGNANDIDDDRSESIDRGV